MKVAKRTNPELWERIVARAKAKARMGGNAGQWRARARHSLLFLDYKKAGGGYSGAKKETGLSKWTKQNWRTKSGKPSSETGERYLPEKAIKSLSPAEYAATSRAKREGTAKGKQFVAQPKSIAKKVAKFRK
jgi:hypothetical protein